MASWDTKPTSWSELSTVLVRIKQSVNALTHGGGGGGGGGNAWGSITGTLSSQTDLQTALNGKASASDLASGLAGKADASAVTAALADKADTSALTSGLATKQDTLVSGTNIKTVNGTSLLGSGDVPISVATTIKTASITLPSGSGVIEHIQTITDAEVTPTSKIGLSLGVFTDEDENDPEFLDISAMSAKPASGAFDVVMSFAVETSGVIKLNYIVGA